ncbi:hypothetical protein Fmac_004492 [Flemingia macrophylla]|uniref:Uncharacterized protein n=1 Tax=Flemingia macrophylla TaxID=520843 RepID=A0ABD1N524_9FABA
MFGVDNDFLRALWINASTYKIDVEVRVQDEINTMIATSFSVTRNRHLVIVVDVDSNMKLDLNKVYFRTGVVVLITTEPSTQEEIDEDYKVYYTIDLLDRSILLENESRDVYLPTETYDIIKSLHTSNPSIIRHGTLGLTEPPYIGRWHGLIRIELMDNKICELPHSPDCPKLKVLLLQGNADHMPMLQHLDLSYISIRDLPISFSKLLQFQEFYLRGCDLFMELPPEIGHLKNLEELNLDGTLITHLPKEVGELINFENLSLSFDGYHHVSGHEKKVEQISNEDTETAQPGWWFEPDS